jgi:nucleotide-binding universal stress UspA family protein
MVVPRDGDGATAAPESVLVAADLSTSTIPLVAASMQLFGRGSTQVTVVHGVESLESERATASRARWLVPEFRGYVLGDALSELEATLPAPRTGAVEVQLRVAAGPVVETIEATAAEVEADLIVMGRGSRSMRLGSNLRRVLRRTDRALLILPDAAARHIAGHDHPRLADAA